MFAKIAQMMRRVHLTDEDLEISEQALRRLANIHRQDAARQRNPSVREGVREARD